MNTIKEFIDSIGVKTSRQSIDKYNLTEYWIKCPLHKDNTPSFRFNDLTWKCWGCNKNGKLYNLYALYYNISIEEAKLVCGDTKIPRLHRKVDAEYVFKTFDLESALLQYPIAIDILTYKYIDADVVEKYKIRWIDSLYFKSHLTGKSYHIKDRIAFPIYRCGVLQAITSRVDFDVVDTKIKYMFTPFSTQKGGCLYGVDYVKSNEPLYVVEGPMDVLAMDMQGKSSVSLLCCDISAQQLGIILDLIETHSIPIVYFIFDGDEAGVQAKLKTETTLEQSHIPFNYEVSVCNTKEDPYSAYVINEVVV